MKRTTSIAVSVATALGLGLATAAQSQGTNPKGVNPTHYQCYNVEAGQVPSQAVRLQDQFGSSTVKVLTPLLLCAPTAKNGMPLRDKTTHYVCYQDEGIRTPEKKVSVTNQFGRTELLVTKATTLCVPSLKKLLAP